MPREIFLKVCCGQYFICKGISARVHSSAHKSAASATEYGGWRMPRLHTFDPISCISNPPSDTLCLVISLFQVLYHHCFVPLSLSVFLFLLPSPCMSFLSLVLGQSLKRKNKYWSPKISARWPPPAATS